MNTSNNHDNPAPAADPIQPSAIVNAGSLSNWTPATRYPDESIQSLTPAFDKLRLTSAAFGSVK